MQSTIYIPKIRIRSKRIDIFPYWIGLLVLGLLFGAVGAYFVLRYGLQVTGLSNQVPWGLWITVDLSSIALGGSAFVFGTIVYLLNLKRFEVIGRLSVLLGFLGYSTAGLVLFFDLGQPLRFYFPVIHWQVHSLLWEITMCVVLYLSVLAAELYPVVVDYPFFKRFPILGTIAHYLHKLGPFLAVVGLTLSILHQASLGATYGVLGGRGMWFNPTAPILFILSAVSGGTSLLFLLGVFVFRVMRPGLVKDEVLYDVAKIAGSFILLCIYINLWNWAVTNYYSFNKDISLQTQLLNSIAPYSMSFWFGQVFFSLIPGLVLIFAGKIKSFKVLMVFAALPVFCTILMRWNYNFSGLIASITYDPFTPEVILNTYMPTWKEWAVAIGVISYWLMGFSLAARFLPFGSQEEHTEHA
jgi:molybdopterin-containing oxidoreductase family membrane subunit